MRHERPAVDDGKACASYMGAMVIMTYIITDDETSQIDFAPKDVVSEVLQNLLTILSTVKGSIPLDRALGIDGDIVDLPIQQAQARMTQEIFDAVKRYEPRASIERITFTGDINGRLTPRLEVRIRGAKD